MMSVIALPANRARIAEEILEDLPEWFGIPAATADYVKQAEALPMFAYIAPDHSPLGFVSLKQTSEFATEIHVIGVRRRWHQNGIGRELVKAASEHAMRNGSRFLSVKTIAATKQNEHYAATRAFYESVGFLPVEELPLLWGPNNPCLLMIQTLGERHANDTRKR